MSGSTPLQRFRTIFRIEFNPTFKRPLFLVLLALLVFSSYMMAKGDMQIQSGDTSVGGDKVWLTSEFAAALVLSMLVFLFYMFFIAIAAGMSVIRDDENKVGEILHATRLTPGEYVWGKFLAIITAFSAVLLIHVGLMVIFNHAVPSPIADDVRGPLDLANYLKPALMFGLPTIIFFTGVCFWIGAVSRKPILVFVVPVAILLVTGFFLWDWSPSWLDPRINKVLMLVEPSGFRWLNETFLNVDRGVEFYNTASIPYAADFLLSRLAMIGVSLGFVALTVGQLGARLRGRVSGKKTQPRTAGVAAPARATPLPTLAPARESWGASRAAIGLLRGTLTVARFEFAELKYSPGLYLFGLIILIQVLGNALTGTGPFDTPLLFTSGVLAVGSLNTLSLTVCLLLLFYTVESLNRERGTGMGEIFYASPLRTASLLAGKALANALVATVILVAAGLGILIALLIQGRVPLDVFPLLVTWVPILIPTFLVWSGFVMAVQAVTGNRYATYGVGLAALILTGYLTATGRMNWVGNWMAWSAVRWTDMGVFELNRLPLVLNRLLMLSLFVFFIVFTVRTFDRRRRDATRMLHRLRVPSLLRASVPLLPFIAVPLLLGGFLWAQVVQGFQGRDREQAEKNYWKANLETYKDYPLPAIRHANLDLRIDPKGRSLVVDGDYRLMNHLDHPLERIPLTLQAGWDSLSWTLNGQPTEPEDRSGLYVFKPEAPLRPGQSLTIGWSGGRKHPSGITKNGGGTGEFILPSGVVLTSFGGAFSPVLGFQEGVGVDEDNATDPREFPDDHHEGVTRAAFGSDIPFTTRIRIRGPEAYRYNSVGTLVSDETADGVRTAVWESDHPVNFFNVVAGHWAESVGEGTRIFYHPEHAYNIEEMQEALDAARRFYSEWFYTFPWRELKLSEFPDMASYAQGFPTNITFSEGVGFLTKSDPRANAAFMVTAHEAAHQWWGNILLPGHGPGGNILSEGMAHFSTALLFEEIKGDEQRMNFLKNIEDRYGERRQADAERPLVRIDGAKPGDTTVTYDKGGWVFWMLLHVMGREAALAGIQDFIAEYSLGPDHALIEDFLRVLRKHAPDPVAFDGFVDQWFLDVVVPEFRIHDAEVERNGEAWEVTCRVENTGSGRMPVSLAAVRGERFPDEEDAAETSAVGDGQEPRPESNLYRDARAHLLLGPGESRDVRILCRFEPERLVVDPDVMVLQLNRELAVADL